MVGTQAEGVLALKPNRAQFSTPACLSSRHLPAIDSASPLNSTLPNFPLHVPNMLDTSTPGFSWVVGVRGYGLGVRDRARVRGRRQGLLGERPPGLGGTWSGNWACWGGPATPGSNETMASKRRGRSVFRGIDPPSTRAVLMSRLCHKQAFGWGTNIYLFPPSSPPFCRSRPYPALQQPCPVFPPRQLSENVSERDICGLVLSVAIRMNQPFIDETGVKRVLFAEEPQPQPRPCKAKTSAAVSLPVIEDIVPVKVEEATDADQICLENVVASTNAHMRLLPEMLRVREWFQT